MSSVGDVAGVGTQAYTAGKQANGATKPKKSYLQEKPDPGFHNTTSGGIHFTGLGSGQDYDTLISKMVQKERGHIMRLLKWRKEWDDKSLAFEEVKDLLRSWSSTLSLMDTPDEFFVKDTASSNTEVLTAAATSEAGEGTHKVEVKQLAQNDIYISAGGFASKDAVATSLGADGYFQYEYNGKYVGLSIPKNMTAEMMVTRINNDSNNPGVRASLIYDGDKYHLQLRGKDQGEQYKITEVDLSRMPALTTDSNGNEYPELFKKIQGAQDAIVKVDGWDQEIRRSSNTFSDVFQGITFTAKNIGDTTITTSVNADALKDNIVKFVDGLNAVIAKIRDLSKVDPLTKAGSLLTGNYGLQLISTQLRTLATSRGAGLGFDDAYSTLGTIGITTDAREGSPTQGELLIDEEKLAAALKKDPTRVAKLFCADNIGETESTDFFFESQIDSITLGGVYDVKYKILGDPDTIAAQPNKTFADAFEATINGKPVKISKKGNTYFLTSMSGPSKGLMVRIANMAPGDYSGTVKIAQGKTAELAARSSLLAGSEGPLHILQENYKDIHDNINKKIEYEERRLIDFEKRLRSRFARLEALLGNYDQLSKSITMQIKKLGGGK